MEFAIKIGDKYLSEIDAPESKGGITGPCTILSSSEGIPFLRLIKNPTYFSSISIRNKIGTVIELMRWGDIETMVITILPKEV